MEQNHFVPGQGEAPDLDAPNRVAFRAGFMQSILLSLLEQNQITQAQYESCVEKVRQKYVYASNASSQCSVGQHGESNGNDATWSQGITGTE